MALTKIITPSVTDNAITLAKMASGTDGNIISYDASGNPVAIATGSDGQVLTSTGAGSPPAFETVTIADNAVTLAKMASGTDGNIISYDTSGNPVAVATGSSGQILTSAGAGAVPSFQTPAGGGKILQVLTAFKPARQSISATSYTDVSNMSVTITPTSSSSKIFVTATINTGANAAYEGYINLVKNSTAIMQPSSSGSTQLCSLPHRRINSNDVNAGVGLVFLDSPSTTSSTTYKIQAKIRSGGVLVFGGVSDTSNGDFWSAPCSMVVMEVGA
jgi:hypothetical protein